jgi:hypothetical protein
MIWRPEPIQPKQSCYVSNIAQYTLKRVVETVFVVIISEIRRQLPLPIGVLPDT